MSVTAVNQSGKSRGRAWSDPPLLAVGSAAASLAGRSGRDWVRVGTADSALAAIRGGAHHAAVLADAAQAAELLAAGTSVIVVATPGGLDLADAALDAGAADVLPDDAPDDEIRLILGDLRPGVRDTSALHGPKLAELSAEVARIARALEGLARSEAAEEGEAEPAPFSGNYIRSVIRARRARAQFFPGDLFADPAWDILLDLMAARLESKRVSVSSLCIAAAVPPTTALRWIKSMTDAGLLERRPDPADARRIFIDLSDAAAEKMSAYLAQAAKAGAAL